MSKTRWLLPVLLIVVVVLIIVGFLLYRYNRRAKPPLTIELSEYPRNVTAPSVTLWGHVSQAARIEVTRDSSSLSTFFSDNNFHFDVELEPGKNTIEVSARTDDSDSESSKTVASITWEPKNPPPPVINPLPATTNLPAVSITGTTYPNGKVQVTVTPDLSAVQKTEPGSARPQGQTESQSPESLPANGKAIPIVNEQTTGKDGAFQVKVQLPNPGPYKVAAIASNSLGKSSDASPEVKFLYDPDWYQFSPAVEPPTAKRTIRKANIVLAHKQLTITLETTLPRDDPAVTSLLANRTKLDEFLDDIFGLQINGTHYTGEFDDVVPQIVLKDRNATIKATTASYRTIRDFLPLLHGQLRLEGRNGFPFSSPDDSLSIRPYDYTIESISPPPTLFENDTMTWAGSKPRSYDDPYLAGGEHGQVKMQLDYRPFASPRNLLRLAQVSPYSFWKYPGVTIPLLISGLLSLVPILWVLWLVGESPVRSKIDEGLRNDLARLSKTLITLSLIITVYYVSWGLAYLGSDVRPLTGFLETHLGRIDSTSHPALLASASLAVLFVALICQVFAGLVSDRTWGLWFARISKGIRNAALVSLLITATGLLDNHSLIARFVSFLIIVETLLLFYFHIGKVLRHDLPIPKYRRRLLLLALVVLIVFIIPLVIQPAPFNPRSAISESFSLLQDLAPYAVAIGLLMILKRVDTSRGAKSRLLVSCVGLILFSAFLVGSTPNLFMIPIPFILSIWMFRNFLMHDFSKRAKLDFINDEVVTDRRSLIEKVLAYETAQQFQANVQKLTDKVSSGDITLKEFEDRKLEIEKYAQDKESASTHVNGLRAKDTVLSIGPSPDNWTNGKWCAKWGARLITPFLAVYLVLLLLRSTTISASMFNFQLALSQVLTFVADWLIAAFFFGYYFRYIRGDSGLEKGLRTACAVIICLIPAWMMSISSKTDLVGVFFRAGQTFLYFTLLGMGAFDYRTFRQALRDQFRWRTFARFGDMPSFTAVLSVLVTSVGVGLTTVVTGQFKVLLANLINAAFHQAPGPPP